ncbi:GDSL-type esterase/lipase family protein [Paracoccus sp. MBLB3053]|uniref:GDSL-type esterase/lipase family protein n=1 Tax=Paracoccus aurantius TaxID=3073814 RepID=A0ABU2HRC7_9RHOB|nr:GDSL-type esterase/lipase family protein [Paracoccus sp. MBLB3053]MDS9467154.1 GDSL-type esterase/lipase family protein [Paracoccus sp. MBLB3053]
MSLRGLTLVLALCAAPFWAGAQEIRLLAFGDSLTAGFGLEPDQGLVSQLQEWLRKRGHDVTIINGGVSGDTTADGKARISQSLDQARPDAVIVALGGNDLMSGVRPAHAEANLDAILGHAGIGGRPLLLVGIASPYQSFLQRRSWAAIWPRLAQRHHALVFDNLYAPFFTMSPLQLAPMLQPDHVHASAVGIGVIVGELGPKVEDLLSQVEAHRADTGG